MLGTDTYIIVLSNANSEEVHREDVKTRARSHSRHAMASQKQIGAAFIAHPEAVDGVIELHRDGKIVLSSKFVPNPAEYLGAEFVETTSPS